LSEVVSQWTNPMLVASGLSAGVLGWQAMGTNIGSPKVHKVLNMLDDINAQGGTVRANPLNPNQELNMTITSGRQKLDFRIETHAVPQRYGGDGVTPQRHMNLDLYPDKKVLPNNGHKILNK